MMSKRSLSFLIETALSIQDTPAHEAGTIVFIPRFMANVSLPVREPQGFEYKRKNGRFSIHMLSPSEVGLPYGSYARLILVNITTRAKLSGSHEIFLADTQRQYLKELGKHCSGGKTGSLGTFKQQFLRLLAVTIKCIEDGEDSWQIESLNVAHRASLSWTNHNTFEWETHIVLDAAFAEDIFNHAVPADYRVIIALSHHPLAMDIYFWLTHRYFRLHKPSLVPWDTLRQQFDNQYKRKSHFREKFLKALNKVSLLYPDARFAHSEKGILLLPSRTHIPKKKYRTQSCG